MVQAGNSNTITRNYLDSLLIETRYMNSTNPDTLHFLTSRRSQRAAWQRALPEAL